MEWVWLKFWDFFLPFFLSFSKLNLTPEIFCFPVSQYSAKNIITGPRIAKQFVRKTRDQLMREKRNPGSRVILRAYIILLCLFILHPCQKASFQKLLYPYYHLTALLWPFVVCTLHPPLKGAMTLHGTEKPPKVKRSQKKRHVLFWRKHGGSIVIDVESQSDSPRNTRLISKETAWYSKSIIIM